MPSTSRYDRRLTTCVRSCMLTVAMKTLAERIRELRETKDLSLREFAKKLDNTSPAHISDIENGRRYPSDELLHKIARILDVKFEELKQLDVRLRVEDLRRAVRLDPALGFALRKVADKKVTADDILKLADKKRDREDNTK